MHYALCTKHHAPCATRHARCAMCCALRATRDEQRQSTARQDESRRDGVRGPSRCPAPRSPTGAPPCAGRSTAGASRTPRTCFVYVLLFLFALLALSHFRALASPPGQGSVRVPTSLHSSSTWLGGFREGGQGWRRLLRITSGGCPRLQRAVGVRGGRASARTSRALACALVPRVAGANMIYHK